MIRPVALQADIARMRRHHQVTETRPPKARSVGRPYEVCWLGQLAGERLFRPWRSR